jgi:large repetitive protein
MTGSALGGNMMRSRLKKMAIIAGAGAIATMGTLALNPFSASADGASTSTSVSAPTSLTTGHAVNFTAFVTPTTAIPGTKPTGTVTFTIVGSDNSSVACAGGVSNPTINGKGKAVCKISSGTLVASASPYSVTAVYSGDDNFAGSTGSTSLDVTLAPSHVKLTYDAKPTSGSATTFTATVTGGGAGSLPTGQVIFAVSTSPSAGSTKCSGGNTQTLAASSDATPVAIVTCALQAKWFKVPAATKTDPHPSASWTVTASYRGDNNLNGSTTSKSGASKV